MEQAIDRGRCRRGLSLIESLIATLVLGFAVLAVGMAFAAGQDQAVRGSDTLEGVALAEDLLERVLGLPYRDPDGASDPGPEPGEKGAFDNADDYDGYADEIEPRAPGGAPYRRSVDVVLERMTPVGLGAPVPGLTVTVTVEQAPAGRWTIARFIPEGPP